MPRAQYEQYVERNGVPRLSFGPTYQVASMTPVLLHASQESRHEMIKSYKVMFVSPESSHGAYFNPKVDMLYISRKAKTHQIVNFLAHPNLRRNLKEVKQLALTKETFDALVDVVLDRLIAGDDTVLFDSLKKLTILHYEKPAAAFSGSYQISLPRFERSGNTSWFAHQTADERAEASLVKFMEDVNDRLGDVVDEGLRWVLPQIEYRKLVETAARPSR